MSEATEQVTITIDGVEITVPKGLNLIEAAARAGIEIPHYCYHPHLSIAGNCRMCQVRVEGQPKLTIACNTGATQGMVVKTQRTAEDVAEAQRATLEFILINHPIDCTVCDQAGHCKLQDYYYEYNGEPSRFLEEKVHKVKALPVGPEVILDGERCILCTRCVRFCDEVTETSELGVFNRGDQSVIGVQRGRELTNPLSGTVVDLCPVGALTHRRWRFNTRIWYTDEIKTLCTGCSTGCNAKVAVRDGKIVQVKARMNSAVNKEWMCDEGRYGFDRFLPSSRLTTPVFRAADGHRPFAWNELANHIAKLAGAGSESAVLLSPYLTLEEVWTALEFARAVFGMSVPEANIAMQIRQRDLTPVQRLLISPDYAANIRAFEALGALSVLGEDFRDLYEAQYRKVVDLIRSGSVKRILLVGDFAVLDDDADEAFTRGLSGAELTVALTPRGLDLEGPHRFAHILLPGRSVLEKGGVMINGRLRLQRLGALIQGPIGSQPEWMLLNRMAQALKKQVLPTTVADERSLFREMTSKVTNLNGLTLMKIGESGIDLADVGKVQQSVASGVPA